MAEQSGWREYFYPETLEHADGVVQGTLRNLLGELDDERLAAMRRRAEDAISSTPVTFTGHLTNTEVRELYAGTDFSCFLNCSAPQLE